MLKEKEHEMLIKSKRMLDEETRRNRMEVERKLKIEKQRIKESLLDARYGGGIMSKSLA